MPLPQDTGYTEDRFYIHCDGALFGMMVGGGQAGWLTGWLVIHRVR